MVNQSVLAIDLGSSYTKVAVRSGINGEARVLEKTPISLDGADRFFVPSVVARVDSGSAVQWVGGSVAASQLPGSNVRVFQDWKAALFAENGAAAKDSDGLVAAEHFLRILGRVVKKHLPGASELPVRVAVPRLAGVHGVDEMMRELLGRTGWKSVAARPTIYEPESNAIGLLSRGKNATWMPRHLDFSAPPKLQVAMQSMLEPGIRAAFRNMHDCYSLLVTDVGAFTTDFGYVEFDSSFKSDDWSRPRIIQWSVPLGVRQLDVQVRGLLEPAVQSYFDTQSIEVWERRKRQLYAGESVILNSNSGQLSVGEGLEREAIQEEIKSFAERVVKARQNFLVSNRLKGVHEEAVTGGGSAIKTLRDAVWSALLKPNVVAHDLWDSAEPEKSVRAGGGQLSPVEKDLRRRKNSELVRTASAVGGVSVFFE